MKKILLIVLLSLSIGTIKANPIMVYFPEFKISEIYIDSTGKWFLEIAVHMPIQLNLANNYVDSLILHSNSGQSKIKSFPINQYDTYVIITEDSLVGPLQINSQDDLELYFYGRGITEYGYTFPDSFSSDEVVFGYSNPLYHYEITTPLHSPQSICHFANSYNTHYLDNSPTLGLTNDTVDATAILTGRLYDLNYNNITTGAFKLNSEIDSFYFDSNGFYHDRILARNNFNNSISMFNPNTSLPIDTFSINAEPHQIYYHDIHVKTSIDNINKIPFDDKRISVIIAPNPFSKATTFYIDLPEDDKFSKACLYIYNSSGKIIRQVELPKEYKISSQLEFDKESSGVYYYRLVLDNNIRKVGQIILN